jgi:glyoxylase I family protein
MTMGFAILGLDHVVLRVADLERALAFYCGVLGCTEERRLAELGLVQLRAGRSLIDLVDVSAPLGQKGGAAASREGRNMDHFCVRIEPFDEAAIRVHLQEHGVEVGSVEQRYGAEGMGPSLYIEDPDGNVVELRGPPERRAED